MLKNVDSETAEDIDNFSHHRALKRVAEENGDVDTSNKHVEAMKEIHDRVSARISNKGIRGTFDPDYHRSDDEVNEYDKQTYEERRDAERNGTLSDSEKRIKTLKYKNIDPFGKRKMNILQKFDECNIVT